MVMVRGALVGALVALVAFLSACSPPDPHQAQTTTQSPSEPPLTAIAPMAPLQEARAPKPLGTAQPATVTKVTDGDTVHVTLNSGASQDVRIMGIDTPETVKPHTPVKCGGPEASAHAKAVFPVGAHITVTNDPTQGGKSGLDKYGRSLYYLTEPNGADYQLDVLTHGYGRFAEYGSKIQRHDQYAAAFAQAQAAHVGIWGPPCNGNSY